VHLVVHPVGSIVPRVPKMLTDVGEHNLSDVFAFDPYSGQLADEGRQSDMALSGVSQDV